MKIIEETIFQHECLSSLLNEKLICIMDEMRTKLTKKIRNEKWPSVCCINVKKYANDEDLQCPRDLYLTVSAFMNRYK